MLGFHINDPSWVAVTAKARPSQRRFDSKVTPLRDLQLSLERLGIKSRQGMTPAHKTPYLRISPTRVVYYREQWSEDPDDDDQDESHFVILHKHERCPVRTVAEVVEYVEQIYLSE